MKRIVAAIAGLSVVALLTACGSAGGSPPGSGDTSPDPDSGGGIDHPEGAELVLSVTNRGGFAPPQFLAGQVPSFVLLGDGRLIVQGVQTLEFPGPALPPLQERQLTAAGIQAVLERVTETDLFAEDRELRGAQNIVADAADTVFTLHAGDREVTVSVYALGMLGPPMEPPPDDMITPAEIQAHQMLQRLSEGLLFLEDWLPAGAWADTGWHPYEPEAIRLYVRDATGEPVDDGGLPEQVRQWPIENADPAAFGVEEATFGDGTRCGVVDGDEAANWLADLQQSTQMTRWTDDGERRFSVTPRPLLPHEEHDCPEIIGAF
ncbi:MAG: hypothetical protein ACRDGV_10245 [Candidatus Limnocylindria bacterium]